MVLAEDPPLYRDLMRFKPDWLTPNGWAVKAGVSRTVWADMRRHGNPSRRTLGKLLAAAGSSLAEFEALRTGDSSVQPLSSTPASVGDARSAAWRAAPLPPIPLLQSTIAGEREGRNSGIELTELNERQVIGHIPRPPRLASDGNAYALTILGDSMWPRFRPGRQLIVSPASPVAVGDDVVLSLIESDKADEATKVLIKELVRRSAGFVELRQFNPDVTFRVESAQIAALHKVIGEAI